MNPQFDYIFELFTLLISLAVAEMLMGFSRILKLRATNSDSALELLPKDSFCWTTEVSGADLPYVIETKAGRLAGVPFSMEVNNLPITIRYGNEFGAFAGDQVGYNRPFPGAGHYRGHLSRLYLCGSSCHPGGNITGLAGYNCAQVLLADQGLA